jgi:hypothetical protein
MADLDRPVFKILGNVIIVSRHLREHFSDLQLVHPRSYAARVLGSIAAVRGRERESTHNSADTTEEIASPRTPQSATEATRTMLQITSG